MEWSTTAEPTVSAASQTSWEALRRRLVPRRWPEGLRFLLVLALCALSLELGCTSRPRYRTGPQPEPSNPPDRKTPSDPSDKPPSASTSESKPYDDALTKGAFQVGKSSFYAHDFHGRPTASGEIFDMDGLTAAHRELPLGTIVRVTNLGNGRSVIVKVNDRGPFIEGRILDLSLGAARVIDMVEQGVAEVSIFIVKSVD